MLDEKRINEAKENTLKLLESGKIFKGKSLFTEFFLKNSANSLDCAKFLFKFSSDKNLSAEHGFPNFDGFLWVINASYYSMFYMAKALLENNGIKIEKDLGIHSTIFDAFVYCFYSNGKIQRKFIEDFNQAGEEASELLGKEKAFKIVGDYYGEKDKRTNFTYEMGQIVIESKAKTSLERAIKFSAEMQKLLK